MKSQEKKTKTDKVRGTVIIILVLVSMVILAVLAVIVCFPDQWENFRNGLKDQTSEVSEQSDAQPDSSATEDIQSAGEASAEQDVTVEQIDFSAVQPGDTIPFGNYEQDGDKTNQAEPIEWLVLDKTEDQLLVISQYILDCQQYNTSYDTSVTWETCTLRNWLNDHFLNTAFSADEIGRISVTETGEAVQDRIYLLNDEEVCKYLDSEENRKCSATAQVKLQEKIYVCETDGCSWWWLRNKGMAEGLSMNVVNTGTIYTYGHHVNNTNIGVRPAMWININEK